MTEQAVELAIVPPAGARALRAGVSCSECGLRDLCLPHGLDAAAREELDQVIRRRRPLRRGEMLYVAGRPAHSLYAIRCGSLKTYAVSQDGEEFVQGFYLPGEVLGLESLAGDRYDHFAVALEPTLYCEIPCSSLEGLLTHLVPLRRQLMRIINQRLRIDRHQSFIHNRRAAHIRLASFLLELSRRREMRKLSPTCFRLSMDRRDIANFLGLTLETVSRGFSRFQREGLLEARGKQVRMLKPAALAVYCGIRDHTDEAAVTRALS
jgi:CRP/FNR family transcriptional regulator, anaerobic regulatory protein